MKATVPMKDEAKGDINRPKIFILEKKEEKTETKIKVLKEDPFHEAMKPQSSKNHFIGNEYFCG